MDSALRAIAEPRRREILRLVWTNGRSVGEIAAHFDVTRPAISQHLRVLRDAALVTQRREGRRNVYRARRSTMTDLRAYLGAFWDDELAMLKAAAERAERAGKGARGHRRRRH